LNTSSDKLQKIVQELIKKYNISGLSLAIIENGKIDLHFEFGVKNSTTQEPVLSNTVFEAASLSKPVVAYGALILVLQEHMTLFHSFACLNQLSCQVHSSNNLRFLPPYNLAFQ
jgi:CubicO group peptidase (beta-lactamase class C family)